MRQTGTYEILGNIKFFIPHPLPPHNPPLNLDAETMELYGDAMHYLGKLNEITKRIPNKKRFIKAYVAKEALLSSAIEGVNTTLLDIFTQPLSKEKPDKNTQLVMNYTTALYKTVSTIKKNNLPIISQVILDAHKELMQLGNDGKSNPGNYRKQSVKVGNLIPPPSIKIPNLMSDLEKYINTDSSLAPLIKAGLAHVQFETIHPFLDGNGRIGRMLIVLMLIENGILSEPILYPSYYFKKQHLDYYKHLNNVHEKGDFESWIKFYLYVIKNSSMDAYKRIQDIELLEKKIIKKIETQKTISASAGKTLKKAVPILFNYPVINIKTLSTQLDVSYNTAKKTVEYFVQKNILVEQTRQKRNKLFRFDLYLKVLEKNYEAQ